MTLVEKIYILAGYIDDMPCMGICLCVCFGDFIAAMFGDYKLERFLCNFLSMYVLVGPPIERTKSPFYLVKLIFTGAIFVCRKKQQHLSSIHIFLLFISINYKITKVMKSCCPCMFDVY